MGPACFGQKPAWAEARPGPGSCCSSTSRLCRSLLYNSQIRKFAAILMARIVNFPFPKTKNINILFDNLLRMHYTYWEAMTSLTDVLVEELPSLCHNSSMSPYQFTSDLEDQFQHICWLVEKTMRSFGFCMCNNFENWF